MYFVIHINIRENILFSHLNQEMTTIFVTIAFLSTEVSVNKKKLKQKKLSGCGKGFQLFHF